uniref:Uncharacterized protein n=1 Tax=Rhizophora mucronata TaxID=61149 RepID=A0A2P2Q4D2_RHIMU
MTGLVPSPARPYLVVWCLSYLRIVCLTLNMILCLAFSLHLSYFLTRELRMSENTNTWTNCYA